MSITKAMKGIGVALAIGLVAACNPKGGQDKGKDEKAAGEKVVLQMYVMSKCPFGVQAVDGALQAMEKFGDNIDLKIDYIGDDANGTLSSMHGDAEVQGNIIQMCAAAQDAKKHLAMLKCMNENWRDIPAGWEACAKKATLDEAKLKACKDGEEGKKLLAASYKRAKDVGAQGSPTIKLAGKDYEGGRRGPDFMRSACEQFKAKPKACTELPPIPKVEAIVLTDKRCKDCDVNGYVGRLKGVFPGLESKIVDYADAEGKKIFAEAQLKFLPALLFNGTIDKDTEGKQQIERWLTPAGPYKSLRVKSTFDPMAEICDNQADDDANSKIDCDDEGCKQSLACREEKKGQLDVFIMSQCPYGVLAVNNIKDVLKAFGKDINFGVHFIASKNGDKFDSLHGQTEVDENIRELCAMKYYPKNNKWLDYFWCRNADIRSEDWKKCTGGKTGIDTAKMEKCFTGEEGKSLLEEDIKIGQALAVSGSPTWLTNNRTIFNGVSPEDIQSNFCKANPGLKGCETKLQSAAPAPGAPAAPPAGGSCGG